MKATIVRTTVQCSAVQYSAVLYCPTGKQPPNSFSGRVGKYQENPGCSLLLSERDRQSSALVHGAADLQPREPAPTSITDIKCRHLVITHYTRRAPLIPPGFAGIVVLFTYTSVDFSNYWDSCTELGRRNRRLTKTIPRSERR